MHQSIKHGADNGRNRNGESASEGSVHHAAKEEFLHQGNSHGGSDCTNRMGQQQSPRMPRIPGSGSKSQCQRSDNGERQHPYRQSHGQLSAGCRPPSQSHGRPSGEESGPCHGPEPKQSHPEEASVDIAAEGLRGQRRTRNPMLGQGPEPRCQQGSADKYHDEIPTKDHRGISR